MNPAANERPVVVSNPAGRRQPSKTSLIWPLDGVPSMPVGTLTSTKEFRLTGGSHYTHTVPCEAVWPAIQLPEVDAVPHHSFDSAFARPLGRAGDSASSLYAHITYPSVFGARFWDGVPGTTVGSVPGPESTTETAARGPAHSATGSILFPALFPQYLYPSTDLVPGDSGGPSAGHVIVEGVSV